MHALNPLYPLAAVARAITFPIRAVFVVGLCYFINAVTSPHHWWAHWVLFGMTIATLVVWMKALGAIVETVGVAGAGYLVYRWWTRRHASAVPAARTVDPGTF